MKVLEITKHLTEAPNFLGATKTVAPTVVSQLIQKYGAGEILDKLVNVGPYAAEAVQLLKAGSWSGASIAALQAAIPQAGFVPAEVKAVTNFLGNVETMANVATHMGGGLATAATSMVPVAMLATPFVLAGEEQKKINADPWNPAYDNRPYAMSVRSKLQGKPMTQGQAAAQNQRNALRTSSTAGNPAIQEASLPTTTLPQYQSTIANPHAEEPVAATGKEVAGTTMAKEVGKEVTKAAIENAIKFAEAVEASVAKLIPRFQASQIPGAEQIVALFLFGKGLVNQQWTAAVAGAATAIPLAAIPAMAAEMASELYGTYFVKEPSHRSADIAVDTVKDPQGTKQRLAQLTTEIAKALDKWAKAGLARAKEGMDPNSPNSLARVTARNSVHAVGPNINSNGVFESLEHIVKLADVKKPT
jgi:hypothetical protein